MVLNSGERSPASYTTDHQKSPSSARSPHKALDLSGERVKVFVRVRPPHPNETGGCLEISDDKAELTVHRWVGGVNESQFEFDKVLPPCSTQQEVYQAVAQGIVDDVLKGYNGTVMAYGQTGAGKTHSLSSIKLDCLGIMPRAAADIFKKTKGDPLHHYTVHMAYIQIYMELIQDLLDPERDNLTLRENDNGVFVNGVKEVEVKSMEDCLKNLITGDRNRTVAFTSMNAHSSRSHAIVILTVRKTPRLAASNKNAQKTKVGKLFIVDLAGSERLKKSGSTGLRANEAKSINLSLTCLGMCINALADRTSTHVPFRGSKLTRLLQESLGGNAKTSMLIAVADAAEHVEETMQSLYFGSRAMCVKTQPLINDEELDLKALHTELLEQLDTRDQHNFELESELQKREEQIERLEEFIKSEQERSEKLVEEFLVQKSALEQQLQRVTLERNEAEQQRKLLQAAVQDKEINNPALVSAKTEIKRLSKLVEDLNNELAGLQKQLREQAALIGSLYMQRDKQDVSEKELKALTDNQNKVIKMLEKELKNLQDHVEDTAKGKKKAGNRLEESQKRLGELEQEVSSLRVEIKEKDKKIERMQRQLNSLQEFAGHDVTGDGPKKARKSLFGCFSGE